MRFLESQNDLVFASLVAKKLERKFGQIFGTCLKQTLQIKNYIFCFDETHYYPVGVYDDSKIPKNFKKKPAKIATLLKRKNFTEQKVQFIFNYQDNNFILMTNTSFFIIDYDWFSLDKNLNLVFKPNKELIEHRNCLFTDCKIQPTPIPDPKRKEKPSTEKPNEKLTHWARRALPYVIVVIVLSLVILIPFLAKSLKKDKIEYKMDTVRMKSSENKDMKSKDTDDLNARSNPSIEKDGKKITKTNETSKRSK